MDVFDRMREWGEFRYAVALTALAMTVLAPIFASQAGHFGWGFFPMILCIVLFTVVIPIVVLTDLVKILNRRSPGSEDFFENVRSYFVILAAWWLGIVLLLVLANVHNFVEDFFSSYVERG